MGITKKTSVEVTKTLRDFRGVLKGSGKTVSFDRIREEVKRFRARKAVISVR